MICKESKTETGTASSDEPLAIEDGEGPIGAWYVPVKMAVEWLAALVLLLPVVPIVTVLALLVKMTSRGPVFYRQVRLGRMGRPFTMYKIRSMRTDSEVQTGAVWAVPEDSRCTKVGLFMRATHLDELPQLWNVLKGEMSLVGPRPERPELVSKIEQMIPRYRQRLLVRPGLTGLAQVRLPADSDLEGVARKLTHDIYYVRHVNPLLDVRIALSTALHLTGLMLNAIGGLLVKSDGKAAEQYSVIKVLSKEAA